MIPNVISTKEGKMSVLAVDILYGIPLMAVMGYGTTGYNAAQYAIAGLDGRHLFWN